MNNHKPLCTVPLTGSAHKKPIRTLAFSPDGQTLVSGSDDHKVSTWDVQSKEFCKSISLRYGITSTVFSANNRMVAAVSMGKKGDAKYKTEAYLWDLRTNRVTCLNAETEYYHKNPCFLPDSKFVAFMRDPVRIYDVTTGKEIYDIQDVGGSVAMAIRPDGEQFIFGIRERAKIRVWNVKKKEIIEIFNGPAVHRWCLAVHLTCLALSADGRLLASASSPLYDSLEPTPYKAYLNLWDLEKGKELPQISGEWKKTASLTFLPDNQTLISFHDPQSDPSVVAWSSESQSPLATWKPEEAACSMAVSPDGKLLATGDNFGIIRFRELEKVLNIP